MNVSNPRHRLASLVGWCIAVGFAFPALQAQTLKNPPSLEQQLLATDPTVIAREAKLRGDAKRGAVLFYKSAAACAGCHVSGDGNSPLGPNLATLGNQTSDVYLVESLLRPSQAIRKGYETHSVLTVDGKAISGLVAEDREHELVMRDATDLMRELIIAKSDIEAITKSERSMMPDGLLAVLKEQRDVLDLIKYVLDVAHGGADTELALRPTAEQLAVRDDSTNLDHAGIIKRLRDKDFEAGERIYRSDCSDCHGSDGNRPSLPTARAFGTQPLKFGADPYSMFMTLTRGNGLMAPMSHLTPHERYQVVHFIRERFMKRGNPVYTEIDAGYLAKLPQGTEDGTAIEVVDRDYGPALASHLERDFSSVLNVQLNLSGSMFMAYDLHTMDHAAVWRGGFLDLSQTQHQRPRGEGTAAPIGEKLPGLALWRWGHASAIDSPRDQKLPRGPLPSDSMEYRGHYLHDDQVVLSYAVDGRDILESPTAINESTLMHTLHVGPGQELVLSVAGLPHDGQANARKGLLPPGTNPSRLETATLATSGGANDVVAFCAHESDSDLKRFVAAAVSGDTQDMQWRIDSNNRLILEIPADDEPRCVRIVRCENSSEDALANFISTATETRRRAVADCRALCNGGKLRWPETLRTVGYLGLEKDGYTLDTLTIPDATPWKTWFRTSALDFFPDGRMAVATYGGDVWIVSGIDNDLLHLQWKRFAAGLYEPFGLKVVDDELYVTCKDRIVRLRDRNEDEEADFYESFSADTDVSINFHAFNFDLQTDDEGNFYYAKSGHGADFALPGAVIRVSRDGRERSVYSTGFRTPNGMGSMPGGRMTVSDNQGQWMPASKINLLRPGGYYGWVANYSIPGMWQPDGGKINLNEVKSPPSFDPPIVWMPQNFDNSSGGQVWVDDPRFGPLSGRLLHTSFGKGWMSYLMQQELGSTTQAAIIKLPFDFRTGIMRARVNPADGQVYAAGLQGWNGGARPGLLDQGIQRLRYTGQPFEMVTDCQVEPQTLVVSFNFELDPSSAADTESYEIKQWNYLWRQDYGSDMYSPTTGKVGVDRVEVKSVVVSADRKHVRLVIPQLRPVHQLHLVLRVKRSDGSPFEEEVYWTLNDVPE